MPYRQHADAVEFYLVRAKLRADGGEAPEAVASFESALREHRYSSEPAAHYGFAEALVRAGRVKDAQRELERVRAAGVEGPMLETLAARIKLAAGDKAGAVSTLAQAQKRYPDSRAVAYAYIAALQDAGQSDAALAALRQTITQYPKDARLYAMQAKAYAGLGKRALQYQA